MEGRHPASDTPGGAMPHDWAWGGKDSLQLKPDLAKIAPSPVQMCSHFHSSSPYIGGLPRRHNDKG